MENKNEILSDRFLGENGREKTQFCEYVGGKEK